MKQYRVDISKTPGWIIAAMDQFGIPQNFCLEELTDTQKRDLAVIAALSRLVDKGEIIVEYASKVGVQIRFLEEAPT